MEKLVKLLNEAHRSGAELFGYCIGNFEWKYYAKNNWLLTIDTLGYTDEDYEFHHFSNRDVCGKDGGFIKWLVENDKIDIDAYKTVYDGDLDKRKTLTMSIGGDEFYQVTEHGVYESLLMLLSISDTPIEDLISYLK